MIRTAIGANGKLPPVTGSPPVAARTVPGGFLVDPGGGGLEPGLDGGLPTVLVLPLLPMLIAKVMSPVLMLASPVFLFASLLPVFRSTLTPLLIRMYDFWLMVRLFSISTLLIFFESPPVFELLDEDGSVLPQQRTLGEIEFELTSLLIVKLPVMFPVVMLASPVFLLASLPPVFAVILKVLVMLAMLV